MGQPGGVLVTGAAGLIGSAVTRLLREQGRPVVACDDFSNGTWQEDAGIVWERCDVADAAFGGRMSLHAVSLAIHCAAHPGGRSVEEPAEDVRVNALGSARVFEWCARSKVPVVYLSSSAVYGDQPPSPIAESASLRPATPYAVCKVACEQLLPVLEARYGLRWLVLRLFATYGAGHRPGTHQGIVNVLMTQLLAGGEVLVRGSLDRVRDLLAVEDAAQAIVACAGDAQLYGHTLNVGTGVPTTIREMIDRLCEALGRRADEVPVKVGEPTAGDPFYSVADISAVRRIGWAPRVSVADGFAALAEHRLREAGATTRS